MLWVLIGLIALVVVYAAIMGGYLIGRSEGYREGYMAGMSLKRGLE